MMQDLLPEGHRQCLKWDAGRPSCDFRGFLARRLRISRAYSSVARQLQGDILEQALGTSDHDALIWWNGFTQFYEGVLDDADG